MAAGKRKPCRLDHSGKSHGFGPLGSAVQGFFDLTVAKRADRDRDQSVSEIAVGIELNGRDTVDGGVFHIDGVCDERCRDIRGGGILC